MTMLPKHIAFSESTSHTHLTFGLVSIIDLARSIYDTTGVSLGIHGSSVDILTASTPSSEPIRDLDIFLISTSDATHSEIKTRIETTLQTRMSALKGGIGDQCKGVQIGGVPIRFSVTLYSKLPTCAMFDDIAHSKIFWLAPREILDFKFNDPGLATYLNQHQLLLTPAKLDIPKLAFRIAMREAKGWQIHSKEMDQRVYEASHSFWKMPALDIVLALNFTASEHFEYQDTIGRLRLIFFFFTESAVTHPIPN